MVTAASLFFLKFLTFPPCFDLLERKKISIHLFWLSQIRSMLLAWSLCHGLIDNWPGNPCQVISPITHSTRSKTLAYWRQIVGNWYSLHYSYNSKGMVSLPIIKIMNLVYAASDLLKFLGSQKFDYRGLPLPVWLLEVQSLISGQ